MNLTKAAFLIVAMSLTFSLPVSAEDSQTKFDHSQEKAPDNSSKNKRDKVLDKPTAQNQSNAKSDVALTREVRRAIMKEKGMSINAQNVKIITKHGVMILRGPVATEDEKELIGRLAKDSGATAITNQLEPKRQ
jgi:osmotically-inducible protein OsmY